MRIPRYWCLLLLAAVLFSVTHGTLAREKDASRAQPRPAAVRVTLDTAEVPELADWADQARRLVVKWHPLIAEMLKSDGFTPPAEVKLVFKKDMKGVAGTAGTTIFIAADWVKQHPEDTGMVIHELTHVIQSYPKYDPPWLVEGIADYVRFYHFEPRTKLPRIDPAKARYQDGYQTTAQFLAWAERKYDKALVAKLNRALRQEKYKDELFQTYTSRSLDQLWAEFVAASKGR
jgi:hypothetical protein